MKKNPDHQSSSKNPVISKNWSSNYRGSTVLGKYFPSYLKGMTVQCNHHHATVNKVLKKNGYTFRGGNPEKCFCSLSAKESTVKGENTQLLKKPILKKGANLFLLE